MAWVEVYIRVNLTVRGHLESASGAGWVLAWAVAVTLDLDVGQLGDGDNGDGGVKSDAKLGLKRHPKKIT